MVLSDGIELVELSEKEASLKVLPDCRYFSSGYYDVSVKRSVDGWNVGLLFKRFQNVLEKSYRGRLFEEHVGGPRVFAAVLNGEQVGWIELGFDAWNNRMRVWEFLVREEYRGRGIGSTLMNRAVEVAREKGARMVVLETQSNNAVAIDFYLKFGFELIGFDVAAYSNEDVDRKEVRIELELKL
jgi:ribosomal protein S18 acetylase RimI-like enzyme